MEIVVNEEDLDQKAAASEKLIRRNATTRTNLVNEVVRVLTRIVMISVGRLIERIDVAQETEAVTDHQNLEIDQRVVLVHHAESATNVHGRQNPQDAMSAD